MQPGINLEITVPHISLSKQHRQKGGDHDKQSTTEQVHIVFPGLQADQHDRQVIEASLARIQKERFHIFQVKNLAAQGHTFLLQILRGRRERMRPGDELAFTIEFHSTQGSPEIAQGTYPAGPAHIAPKVIAGLSTIVIFLDEEGKPGGYSIDGAES